MNDEAAFPIDPADAEVEVKVFDWVKAAQLIGECRAKTASAGLAGDWEWTSGKIWQHGRPVPLNETYTYLASVEAIPQLEIDGERVNCFRRVSETPGWNAGTYWPKEAREALRSNAVLQLASALFIRLVARAGLPPRPCPGPASAGSVRGRRRER